ncbi:MAG: prepilin-type N-terminal cleavage/methylation domain-containing protein [Actinomycetota bacterium]
MFQRFHAMREQREGGFTLIELLVVILIIAILAAIAIPVFLNQRQKGYRAQVQSALRSGATAIESYSTGNNGSYVGASVAGLKNEGLAAGGDVTVTIPAATLTANSYCLQATHTQLTGETWKFDSAVGKPEQAAC